MKKLSTLLVAVAILSLTLSSCDIDIEPGYDPAARVTGTYWVEEYSSTYDVYTEFEIRVYQSGYSRVVIANFYGANVDVYADVRGNVLYIPFQVRNGYEIEGRATYYSGKLDFTYTVRDTYGQWVRDRCEAEAWLY